MNAEQASKDAMQEPTRRENGEGCHHWTRRRQHPVFPAGVLAMACMYTEIECNTGSPNGEGRDSQLELREEQAGPYGVAERPGVAMKLGNAGGAKGP